MKIKILVLLIFILPNISYANESGYGPWKLGMSKNSVASFEKHGPYKKVKATGGLETFNAQFNGKKKNISFVFGNNGLNKIQVWVYEGANQSEALTGWIEAYTYLKKQFGDIEFPGISVPKNVKPQQLKSVYANVINTFPKDKVGKIQMAPIKMPNNMVVYASLFKHPVNGYYVFVYYTSP